MCISLSQERCTKEKTLADLEGQLVQALGGAPSAVDELATQSGTKDKYFTHFVSQLQDLANEVHEKHKGATGASAKSEVQRQLAALREKMPADIFNPVL